MNVFDAAEADISQPIEIARQLERKCDKCGKTGHFAIRCQSKKRSYDDTIDMQKLTATQVKKVDFLCVVVVCLFGISLTKS